ncbi:MAG: cytochrome c oxidase subunit 3 [Bacteriovorax sp.]|nr:cytochrome c oxidase subunit 3 [Bacteriovorax sp.]
MALAEARNNIMQSKEGDKVISSVAMVVALISFGMLFLTLMMSFALYRFTAPVWPPAGMEKPSLLIPSISTFLIILSSLAYFSFEKKTAKGLIDKQGLMITLILGSSFMVSQAIFWNQLKSHGIFVSSGIFASVMYAFTWIHAAHIVMALVLLVWLYRKLSSPDKMTAVLVSSAGKFWHFLGIVWLVMFVTIFVL